MQKNNNKNALANIRQSIFVSVLFPFDRGILALQICGEEEKDNILVQKR